MILSGLALDLILLCFLYLLSLKKMVSLINAGYNSIFVLVLSLILALELPSKLSEKHLVQFETDGYTLWNDENLRGRTMVDENDDEYLKELESTHQERIGKLRPAIATE